MRQNKPRCSLFTCTLTIVGALLLTTTLLSHNYATQQHHQIPRPHALRVGDFVRVGSVGLVVSAFSSSTWARRGDRMHPSFRVERVVSNRIRKGFKKE